MKQINWIHIYHTLKKNNQLGKHVIRELFHEVTGPSLGKIICRGDRCIVYCRKGGNKGKNNGSRTLCSGYPSGSSDSFKEKGEWVPIPLSKKILLQDYPEKDQYGCYYTSRSLRYRTNTMVEKRWHPLFLRFEMSFWHPVNELIWSVKRINK